MRKKFFTLLILITVALCPVYARAQQNNSKPLAKDEAQAALRDKAYELLESLAGQLGTMQSPENRARIGSNIAWSLWTHNEARAREVLASVQQDINAGLQVPNSEDPEDLHTLIVFMKLRTDTVQRIAQRDPELAYEFFNATALSPDLKLSEDARASELDLETGLAKQVAASNPELTLQLGRKLLATGFPEHLIDLVRKLKRKHKEPAMALYQDIVHKLSGADFVDGWIQHFALDLAHSFSPPDVRESDFNDLLNLFIKAAVANGCTKKMDEDDPRVDTCRALTPAISLIAKINPSRARQLDRWRDDDGYTSSSSAYAELAEVAEDGTVDEVLGLASKYPQMKIEIHWQAFRKAKDEGDLERARRIVTESNLDAEWQQRMLAELGEARLFEIDDAKMAEFMKRLDEVKTAEQRVHYLVAMANQVGEKDRKTTLKLLNRASQITDAMKPGREQTTSRLALALIYCLHKNDRGFEIMESLLPKLNELVEASAKLDGYGTRYLRDGEWNMSGEGLVGGLLTGLAQNAGYFAWCDFDRAVTLTGQFERPEIRIMAQLKLAQGILAGPPKALPMQFITRNYVY